MYALAEVNIPTFLKSILLVSQQFILFNILIAHFLTLKISELREEWPHIAIP